MDYLINWFESMNFVEQIFACIAIVFTVLLIVQFVLLMIGAASHGGGDMNGHDMGGDGHDFGQGHDMDVGHDGDFGGHDFDHAGTDFDAGHDIGGHVHGDFGHDFGHGDFGGFDGDVSHDFGHAPQDVGGDFSTDMHDGIGQVAHDVSADADGSFDYDHDMQAGHTHVGQVIHDFGQVQGSVVVDVHSGDIYLADAAPHELMYRGPDVGIPDQDLPDGRTYIDRADKLHGSGFRLFTTQGIIAFFCIYGWTGLIFMKQLGLHGVPAALLAALCGFVGMFLMSLALWGMLKIQSDGTMNIKNALGKSGEVYIPIPGKRENTGKVMVKVQDQVTEFDAVTDDDEKIGTGSLITVIGITKGTTLIVTKHS